MSNSEANGNSNNNSRITWEGCNVLLDINDGQKWVFERLTSGASLKIGNLRCPLQPLIGCQFGSLFQVENGADGPFLSRILSTASAGNNNSQENTECPVTYECKDNRDLVDDNKAQSLSGEDIDELRRKGASGDEIIEALITNSSTFEKKTSFSQEKYLLKKQKKYSPRILLRRPTARSICEAYFKKRPEQIGFLRMDTLSLLLSMANVTSNSDVLVVDMIGGILTGAVAERLGGNGYVCNTYRGSTPYPVDIVRMFNFSNEICERIVHSSLMDLCLSSDTTLQSNDQLEDFNNRSQSNEKDNSSICSISTEEDTVPSEDDNQEFASSVCKPHRPAKAGQKAPPEAMKSWKENGFSSLIVAAPFVDAWSIVKELFPLLSFSAPFVVYHQHLQILFPENPLFIQFLGSYIAFNACGNMFHSPLAQCMHNLQVGKMALGLQITEPWLREYQVLESRTHPRMQMSTSGGYILSGTRICHSN